MHAILRQIVGMVLNGEECSKLQRYIVLKREIATVAAASLEKVRCLHPACVVRRQQAVFVHAVCGICRGILRCCRHTCFTLLQL